MNAFHRKLYALLQSIPIPPDRFTCLAPHQAALVEWWQMNGHMPINLAHQCDVAEERQPPDRTADQIEIRHPISGQKHHIAAFDWNSIEIPQSVCEEPDPKKVFFWLWRFYPDLLGDRHPQARLYPSHLSNPDCPIFSYASTVTAITGALFPEGWQPSAPPERPYLMLFTFSPVQEFVKASRKLLDFWAGSYTLHYLSAWLCWELASELGADSVLTPSLWSQAIADAFLYQDAEHLLPPWDEIQERLKPVLDSNPLRVAGFPNYVAAIVPGKNNAIAWQTRLKEKLRDRWLEMGRGVRETIKSRVRGYLSNAEHYKALVEKIQPNEADLEDLRRWQEGGIWEWNALWEAQLTNTWETYSAAVPIGHPEVPLAIAANDPIRDAWLAAQEQLVQGYQPVLDAETLAHHKQTQTPISAGSWWAKAQGRLARTIQESKNTRTWAIPVAPGDRSSISGLFSAVHPRLLYRERFREGGGVPSGTQGLFWKVLAEVFLGLFDGSERLNAIELTKRMGWGYGDRAIAATLGIKIATDGEELDYEQVVRFPNLSAVASAGFALNPQPMERYRKTLEKLWVAQFPQLRDRFYSRTRGRPYQIPKVDTALNPTQTPGQDFNGVMFSARSLVEDCGITDTEGITKVRAIISQAHKQSGFGESSPADWWVLIYGDGDNMGQYVSGRKLHSRDRYVESHAWETLQESDPNWSTYLKSHPKRMGATAQANLNRALLDFSNRLVPLIAEERFCGKVVYSGGDDVMVALPLDDLPELLLSLRAAWSGSDDPKQEFTARGGYWYPQDAGQSPFFTMGEGATMSFGVVVVNKAVPLATALNHLWEAEKDRAKAIHRKDGICFRVLYGSGNVLESALKGSLLSDWWAFLQLAIAEDISPVLYRLIEELAPRIPLNLSESIRFGNGEPCQSLLCKGAEVIIDSRDRQVTPQTKQKFLQWLSAWEQWASSVQAETSPSAYGATPGDLFSLLRFSAFVIDRQCDRQRWLKNEPTGEQP